MFRVVSDGVKVSQCRGHCWRLTQTSVTGSAPVPQWLGQLAVGAQSIPDPPSMSYRVPTPPLKKQPRAHNPPMTGWEAQKAPPTATRSD